MRFSPLRKFSVQYIYNIIITFTRVVFSYGCVREAYSQLIIIIIYNYKMIEYFILCLDRKTRNLEKEMVSYTIISSGSLQNIARTLINNL